MSGYDLIENILYCPICNENIENGYYDVRRNLRRCYGKQRHILTSNMCLMREKPSVPALLTKISYDIDKRINKFIAGELCNDQVVDIVKKRLKK